MGGISGPSAFAALRLIDPLMGRFVSCFGGGSGRREILEFAISVGGRPDPVDNVTKVMLQPFIIIQLEAKSSGQT